MSSYYTMSTSTLSSSSEIRLPKSQETTCKYLKPIENSAYHQRYELQNGIFDPTIINTPPNEFMEQLKQRMNVYYNASHK